MKTPRHAAAGAALLILIGALVTLVAWPSQAYRSSGEAAVQWLDGELSDDHLYDNPLSPGNPDFGLTIDAALAMYAVGRPDVAEPLTAALDARGYEYWGMSQSYVDFGVNDRVDAGALAKTLVLAEAAGAYSELFDEYYFNERLLINDLKNVVAQPWMVDAGLTRHPGMVHDSMYSEDWSRHDFDVENAFGQSLAIIAFSGTWAIGDIWDGDTTYGEALTDALLRMQCSDGYFLIFPDWQGRTCDELDAAGGASPDGDATAMALSALLAAQDAGVPDLQAPIDRTVAWIEDIQTAGGGWGGGVGTESANTNSTGLILQALAAADGDDTILQRGREFILSAQVTAERNGTSSLRNEIGAIAYNPEEYQQARRSGTLGGRDRWIRASAQATLGLSGTSFRELVTRTVPATGPVRPTDPTGEPTDPGPTGPGTTPPSAAPTTPGAGTTTDPGPAAGQPAPPREATRPGSSSGSGGPGSPRPVTPPAAQAPVTSVADGPRARLAAYLATMLVDGDHVEVVVDGTTYVDYDSTAELVLALVSLGEEPAARDRATAFLLHPASIAAYAHGAPYEAGRAAYAEPLAKLVLVGRLAAGTAGPDAERDARVAALGEELAGLVDGGTVTDVGIQADALDGVTRQAWVSLALRAVDQEARASAVAERMTEARCPDGSSRARLSGDGQCTDDLAATAAAAIVAAAVAPVEVEHLTVTGEDGVQHQVVDDDSFIDGSPGEGSQQDDDAPARALLAAVNRHGVVVTDGGVDRLASARAAAGLVAVGWGAASSGTTLAQMQLPSGGIGADDRQLVGDLATSIAAAPVLSGRSWLQGATAPVHARTPSADALAPAPAGATDGQASAWLTVALPAGFLLLGVGIGAAVVTLRRPTGRASQDAA
ncbi:hypothetical protein [Nocardioides zeae]|uniref:Terpene cyclase/mutase family protein n=1 Tax=Nocardioides zeae TaxID=1457234 RepID=A0A6P0HI03_9ACTN|nr:hypothetical protein [Nocardioides zeae]NEN77255.1 hypothetical protein [Nocardioides zeae]